MQTVTDGIGEMARYPVTPLPVPRYPVTDSAFRYAGNYEVDVPIYYPMSKLQIAIAGKHFPVARNGKSLFREITTQFFIILHTESSKVEHFQNRFFQGKRVND